MRAYERFRPVPISRPFFGQSTEEYLTEAPQYNPPVVPDASRVPQAFPVIRPDVFESTGIYPLPEPVKILGGKQMSLTNMPPPQGNCCLPVHVCNQKEYAVPDKAYETPMTSSSVATAYGGQANVEIKGAPTGPPGLVAPSGFSPDVVMLSPTMIPGPDEGAVGLWEMVRPKTTADWVKIIAGAVAGFVLAKLLEGRE